MDIVLPLVAADVDRYLRLQRPTFERHYADLGRTWLVTRPQDLVDVRARAAGLDGVEIVDQRDVVPEVVLTRELRFFRGREQERNWSLQQLVKLATVAQLDSPFALLADADVIAVARTNGNVA